MSTRIKLEMPKILVLATLRTLRRTRLGLQADLDFVQEQAGHRGSDAVAQGAMLALAAEIDLLTQAIFEFREALGGSEPIDESQKEE